MKQKYHIALLKHKDGVSVSCPDLPGCHSQGATMNEALENIQDAIRGYLELYGAPKTRVEIREMEIASA
jgi:predicted RNase H-like HicB family nuclease